MQIQSPEDLRKLIDIIIGKFESRKQQEAANRLRRIQDTAFTTSSEWLGELRAAIQSIQREFQVDQEIKQSLDQIMQVAKRAWPR